MKGRETEQKKMSEKIIIALCDDNQAAVWQLKELIQEYLTQKKIEATLLSFFDAEEVLHCTEEVDILFLDIDMPGKDGIQVGQELRKRGSQCKIIMATGREDRFKETYRFVPFRFATKPFMKEEIEEYLEDVMKTFVGRNRVEFYKARILYNIEEHQIQYIRAYDGYVEAKVNARDALLRKEISLGKLEEELDMRLFYRVNREYMVNMYYIENYRSGIIDVCDLQIKVSRRNKKDFEKRFQEFDLKYRG